MAKSDARKLHECLEKYEAAVLMFAKDQHVPFTNNRAERDLSMAKVKQKVFGCFRTKPTPFLKRLCSMEESFPCCSSIWFLLFAAVIGEVGF